MISKGNRRSGAASGDGGTSLAPSQSGYGYSPISLLRGDLDRFFDDFWQRSGWGALAPGWGGSMSEGSISSFVPALDVSETDDGYRVTAELPGMKREDVTVNAEGDTLVISGSRCEESEDEGRSYLRRECRSGEFRRAVTLQDADLGKATASMRDGILRVEIPRTEAASRRRRTIPVEADESSSSGRQTAGAGARSNRGA